MGRQRIEVEIEPITRKEWKTARSQELSQGMDEQVCHVLRAGAETEDGNNLRTGVDGQPEPEHVVRAA